MAFTVGMLCCAFAMMNRAFPLLVVGFALMGFMYGGNMCSMSAMAASFFGPKYYGINYTIATCQMIPAAIIGPQILAMSQVGSGSYLGAFWAFGAIAVASLVVSLFIKPPKICAQPVEQCAVGPTFLRRPRTVDAFLCSQIMER